MTFRFRTALAALLTCLLFAAVGPSALHAQPADLFISEYVEGSSFNKAVEIYNGTGSAVALDGYELAIFFNGSDSPNTVVGLSGTLADGDVYVVADDGADTALLNAADLTPSSNFFNGDDAVVLRTTGDAPVDVIGQVGTDPGSEWSSGGVSTKNNTIRRLETACTGDTDPDDPFDPSADYEEFPEDTFGGVGAHTATCGSAPAPPALVISEIMYNPDSPEDDWEWVEVYNPGTDPADLTGFVLDDNNSVAHSSANITGGTVPADGTALLYNADDLSAADVEAAWGPGLNLVPVADWSNGALNNSGDQVALWATFSDYDGDNEAQSNAVVSVSFDDSGAWPSDNNSASIYLTDLTADPADGANWALSTAGAPSPAFDAYQSQAAGGNSGGDVGSPGPGFSGGGPAAERLLLTEIAVAPTDGEFIEIYNPGSAPVDLSDYYLTDATFESGGVFYYNIVTGTNAGGGGFEDFHARFPDGATIAPGEYQTIAIAGSGAFTTTYGTAPTYELYEDGGAPDGIPDLREAFSGSINGQGGLTNSGEVAVLYAWDGTSDRVVDVDYALWGDKNEAVDKSGVSVDGPDADTAPSSYQSDTPVADQEVLAPGAPATGQSFTRTDLTEGTETAGGGNGVGGADETSENLSDTWAQRPPSPGAPAAAPPTVAVVINEIDYDQPGGDDAEFVELYNAGSSAAALGDLRLELVNGSNGSVYDTVPLPTRSLAPGEYYVVCADAATVPRCDLAAFSSIQNGAPDAVALIGAAGPVDAVSYEGTVSGVAEGTGTSVGDNNSDAFVSLARQPDGADTDDNDADFSLRCTTPGTENRVDQTGCTDPAGPPAPGIDECQLTDFAPQTLFPGQTGQALISDLIAAYKPDKSNMPPNYGAARDQMYALIDNRGGVVEGVYSGFAVGGVPRDPSTARDVAQNGGLNAEHTWPQSLGVGGDDPGARTDLHHLFPTRSQINSTRGNRPFGEIPDPDTDRWFFENTELESIPTSNIDAYSEVDFDADRFEPREIREGNTARAMFYIAAVYQSLVSDPDEQAFFNEQLAQLLAWNDLDPVDQGEYERTCNVGQLQDGKVNPFVIDPTLAERAFATGVTISDVQRTPFLPAASAPTTITANIVAGGPLTSVDVRYQVNGGSETAVAMSPTSGPGYEGTLPASVYQDGDRVEYTVVATTADASDQSPQEGFFAGTTPIGSINNRDADGVVRFQGFPARVRGTATAGQDVFSPDNFEGFLEDGTGGISLFQFGDPNTTYAEGLPYVVVGTVDQFSGRTQLRTSTLAVDGPSDAVDPAVRTIDELLGAPEAMENRLVRIDGVTSSTPFPSSGSANVEIQDGTGTLNMRIDGDTGITGSDEPAAPYSVVGIFTQFDPSQPLTEGYQIQPRRPADLLAEPPLAECTATTLSESLSNPPDALGVVTSTFSSPDGVLRVAFVNPEGEPFLNNLEAANPSGQYQTTDGGITWTAVTPDDPPTSAVFELTQADPTVAAVSYFAEAASVCSDPDPLVVDFDPAHVLSTRRPETLRLAGNYPNPFGGRTTIEFALPERADVRLTVYDVMGRRVATLADESRAPGRHQVTWNGRGNGGGRLSSGVYLVRLQAGGATRTSRVTLVR